MISRLVLLASLVVVACPLGSAVAGDKIEHGFVSKVYKGQDGESRYVVFVPPDYNGDKAYPVILFLHGAGERGTDGKNQARVGLGKAIRDKKENFPFITVFPQAQKTWKADSADAKRALAILAVVMKEYKTDPKRVYLTGLSMGGFGTWGLAATNPSRWAAIVPICGGGNPKTAETIKDIPCWCFCGDQDKLVVGVRAMLDALKKAGASPRYTEYPGVGHNSWDRAYATPELYTWLLKHSTK